MLGFPGGASGKEPACQCWRPKRPGFDPCSGKDPPEEARYPAPVFLPAEVPGETSLAGYSPQACTEPAALKGLGCKDSGSPGGSGGEESTCNGGGGVQSLGWEDLLEKWKATLSSILAWRVPWTEEPSGLWFRGSQRIGHDWVTFSSLTVHMLLWNRLIFFFPCRTVLQGTS